MTSHLHWLLSQAFTDDRIHERVLDMRGELAERAEHDAAARWAGWYKGLDLLLLAARCVASLGAWHCRMKNGTEMSPRKR